MSTTDTAQQIAAIEAQLDRLRNPPTLQPAPVGGFAARLAADHGRARAERAREAREAAEAERQRAESERPARERRVRKLSEMDAAIELVRGEARALTDRAEHMLADRERLRQKAL
jgi:hypothetical protein